MYSVYRGDIKKNIDSWEKESNLSDEYSEILSGFRIMILAMSGSFIWHTMGCDLQKLISNNMVYKHLIIMTMIYFAFDITKNDDDFKTKLLRTVKFWAIFCIFIKLKIQYITTIILIIFFFHVVNLIDENNGPMNALDSVRINSYTDEPKFTGIKNDYHRKQLESFSNNIDDKEKINNSYAYKIIGLIFIIGSLDNLIQSHNNDPSKFSFIDTIFGRVNCGLYPIKE
jgi:hypothetical protein